MFDLTVAENDHYDDNKVKQEMIFELKMHMSMFKLKQKQTVVRQTNNC